MGLRDDNIDIPKSTKLLDVEKKKHNFQNENKEKIQKNN